MPLICALKVVVSKSKWDSIEIVEGVREMDSFFVGCRFVVLTKKDEKSGFYIHCGGIFGNQSKL